MRELYPKLKNTKPSFTESHNMVALSEMYASLNLNALIAHSALNRTITYIYRKPKPIEHGLMRKSVSVR